MKAFNTITEKELLKHAYYSLLEFYTTERDTNELMRAKGEVVEKEWEEREQKYLKQFEEVRQRLIELENGAA